MWFRAVHAFVIPSLVPRGGDDRRGEPGPDDAEHDTLRPEGLEAFRSER
jgi:hypothetical protein